MTTRKEIKNFFEKSEFGQELLTNFFNYFMTYEVIKSDGVKTITRDYNNATPEELEEFKELLNELYEYGINGGARDRLLATYHTNKFFKDNCDLINDYLLNSLIFDCFTKEKLIKIITSQDYTELVYFLAADIAFSFCENYQAKKGA